ncbi:unnamed protein product [Rhizophagus irregularis]|nr:unnamed protein product [Rhizophagus irregularis]CAB5182792.1 unnamed protein product [Rhizophagus irregularis]CAB5378268.1 unnamed protein product [Rhizophagus irregularis]
MHSWRIKLHIFLHLPKIGSMSSKAHIYNTTCTDLHETHSREKKTSSKNINKIWIYSERICTKNSEINPVEKICRYVSSFLISGMKILFLEPLCTQLHMKYNYDHMTSKHS